MIGATLIDALDDAGYFVGAAGDRRAARRRGRAPSSASRPHADPRADRRVRALLAECLALQLKERDRFDPAMRALIDNLPAARQARLSLLAPTLRRRRRGLARHDRRDCAGSSPSPARAFGDPARGDGDPRRAVAPRAGFRLAGRAQHARRCRACWSTRSMPPRSDAARSATRTAQYISTQLQSAHWLTKSLEQRARTILNVASEIVRRQDAFLARGRLGPAAAQSEDGRRKRSACTNRRSRARPRTSSSRRRAASSR